MAITKIRSSAQLNIDQDLNAQTHKVINVVDPTNAQDAATKNYVDSHSGLSASNFVFSEVPTGTIDGSNKNFTIANTPTAGTVRLYLNGLRQVITGDYTLSSVTITFVTAPVSGDVILVDYMK